MEDDLTGAPGAPAMVGTCREWCPPAEARERQEFKFLSSCESGKLNRPLVKRYTRSAAGYKFEPLSIRPEPTLLMVARYLLSDVVGDASLALSESYGFVSDRLRSVRQDAAIQQLASPAMASALVASARYHVMVHRVAASTPGNNELAGGTNEAARPLGRSGDAGDSFDPVMNDSRLAECLGHGLAMCDALLRAAGAGDAAEVYAELLSYRLCMSLMEPAVLTPLLRTLSRTRRGLLRSWPVAIVLDLLSRWSAHDWSGFLARVDALGHLGLTHAEGPFERGSRAAAAGDLPLLLWTLLQRYVPLARLNLLRSLAEAFPSRAALPLDDVAALLHCHGSRGRPPRSSVPSGALAGAAASKPAQGAAAAAAACTQGVLPWEQCARLCISLKQSVLLRSPGSEGAQGTKVDPRLLAELRGRHDAGERASGLLAVCFDKSADLDPRSLEVRVRAALSPVAEDPPAGLELPRNGAELSPVILAPLLQRPAALLA